jgi:cephalosporin-C deacetylase-like acetyl esterase
MRFIPLAATVRSGLLLLLPLVVTLSAQAQNSTPRPGDVMMNKFLAGETEILSRHFLDGAKSLDDWEQRRPRLKQEYLDMLGLWPLPEKTPLNAKVTGTVERGEVTIEKVHFQSKPGLYVTANLYRPKKPEGKLPAVLYLCGHSRRGRDGNKTAFQDHGMWFASNGFVCLIVDTLQLGEVAGVHHGTYNLSRWWWQARGYTPAGVECWNAIRSIDYLSDRSDVDLDRITVTGISGGGAATIWVAAADERVKLAIPVSGMSDLQSYVSNKIINGHCDCMFMINTYRWDWATIAALIAPRALLFVNSDKDPIFPMDGNRRIMNRLRQIYKMYNQPNYVDEYVSEGGHDYRPDLRKKVFGFINRYMRGDTSEAQDSADFKPLPGKELRVFPEDKDIPADAINNKIDESFVPKGTVRLPQPSSFGKWKRDLVGELREKSFRPFPERLPPARRADKQPERPSRMATAKLITEADVIEVSLKPISNARGRTSTVIVLNADDVWDGIRTPEWVRPYTSVGAVSALLPRGVGMEWTHKSPPNYVERAHALLGRTVDQGKVWDIVTTVRMLDEETNRQRSWRVVGRGQAGILAAYAALFEPAIKEVVVIDPPVSHRSGPYFLNVLKVLDIPDALGLLAPNSLTLVNAKDKAFDRTAEIYRIAGASEKLQRR